MKTPLATWSDDNSAAPALVWWTRLDQRWQIEVQREAQYTGTLCIFDHDNQNKLVYSEPVILAYGAMFGPDVSDVGSWQDKAIEFVDAMKADAVSVFG